MILSQYFSDNDDFQNCTTDYECAKSCARYFQEQSGLGCLLEKKNASGDNSINALECEDYARLHAWGTELACDRNDATRTGMVQYLRNLTIKCGSRSKFLFKNLIVH